MILGANYAELDKLNPHNPSPKFVSSRLLDNSAVDAFVQHF